MFQKQKATFNLHMNSRTYFSRNVFLKQHYFVLFFSVRYHQLLNQQHLYQNIVKTSCRALLYLHWIMHLYIASSDSGFLTSCSLILVNDADLQEERVLLLIASGHFFFRNLSYSCFSPACLSIPSDPGSLFQWENSLGQKLMIFLPAKRKCFPGE